MKAAAKLADHRLEDLGATALQRGKRARLVALHEAAIPGHIGRQDGDESTLGALFGHRWQQQSVQWPETLCPHRQQVYSAARHGRAIAFGRFGSFSCSSSRRKPGSRVARARWLPWTPAFAGVTEEKPGLSSIALRAAGWGRDVEASSGGAGLTAAPAGLNLRKLTPPAEEK
jgi:hypothetical protein